MKPDEQHDMKMRTLRLHAELDALLARRLPRRARMTDLPITRGLELCRTSEDVRELVRLREFAVPLTPEERAAVLRAEKKMVDRGAK